MTTYGLPFFLEDKTGKLAGSEFIDLHDRMHLRYHCTAHNSSHTAYMISITRNDASFGLPSSSSSKALIALDFGPRNTLGTISFSPERCMPMKDYLTRVSFGSKSRKFIALDSQPYVWNWSPDGKQQWSCLNSNGYLVAYYSLKNPGEPQYEGSSGCMLTVDEQFGHLAPELLASLMIMRHIAEYGL